MLEKIRLVVEKPLRNRGFTSPESRRIIANQILLTGASLLAGAAFFPLTAWPLAFGLGAAIAAVNLALLARSVHWSLARSFSPGLAMLCFGSFLVRFAGTGLAVYLLAVCAQMPLAPLIAGLSSVVVCLSIMGFSRIAGHS